MRRCKKVILAGTRSQIPNAPLLEKARELDIPVLNGLREEAAL